MKKLVDSRLKLLLEECREKRVRCMFMIVGDNSRYQICNLYYILSNIHSKKPSILWCYKKELGFSSHKKVRQKQRNKKAKQGKLDEQLEDPFELFVTNAEIRYCYYKDSHSILGRTFGMCILQDFEAITPNILCRTIETVSGGGVICITLQTMSSLRNLYETAMDFHGKLKCNEDLYSGSIISRFIPRFILSLSSCSNCVVVDDELNVLPISSHILEMKTSKKKEIDSVGGRSNGGFKSIGSHALLYKKTPEHIQLEENVKDTEIGKVISNCITFDQAQTVLKMADVIIQKNMNAIISLTAGRGRGKSAALGLSLACAVSQGFSNIFITAPSAENVLTVFEFIEIGLQSLGYLEHKHFELVRSKTIDSRVGGDSSHSVSRLIRVNIFKEHRQTIQYIKPEDYHLVSQAEIVVMDEAAAIPLPIVKKFLGNHLFIFSSTINGYEGTGRALSLKLINDLKKKSLNNNGSLPTNSSSNSQSYYSVNSFSELNLEEPIRYGRNDPIESWLHNLLCLDSTNPPPLFTGEDIPRDVGSSSKSLVKTLAPPTLCTLYHVDRDALFSYHSASETFLHNLMSLFVSSHYKNTPNDLMLLSDAPTHRIFVLLPPFDPNTKSIPPILVAIQVAVEGSITSEHIKASLSRGLRPSGDLIPWTLCNHLARDDFGKLTGLRIVRIATHPSAQRMGYGNYAVKQLINKLENLRESNQGLYSDPTQHIHMADLPKSQVKIRREIAPSIRGDNNNSSSELRSEVLERAKKIPPLLEPVEDIQYILKETEQIDYIGTAFGITSELLKFWSKLGFLPVYIRQQVSEVTGEHSVILLKSIGDCWLSSFVQDFSSRTIQYISSPQFKQMPVVLALSLAMSYKNLISKQETVSSSEPLYTQDFTQLKPLLNESNLHCFLTDNDCVRLTRYARQMADYSSISDLVPIISQLYFENRISNVSISFLQSAVLLGLGSQRKSIDEISSELSTPSTQLLALFNKAIYKINSHIHSLYLVASNKEDAENEDIPFNSNHHSKSELDLGLSDDNSKQIEVNGGKSSNCKRSFESNGNKNKKKKHDFSSSS
ncbi:KRE33p like superfamily I ATPAse fused to an acetylase [Cryptosporidium sp. chipmunk genotype I]|uniref:KRE33p like superfamily I ATPAse fused to an acetylase n=1 Tax=Cryptosporidium sp. chipmunk genotype I TaxID=1280935 RepID=UPI00351AABDD|nr:KRE33p like superfamily I ATPAse fused to an acetylase [Cryptosporidium sp. chipmunk genotype I]